MKDFGNWVEDYGVNTDYYFYKPGELRIEENGEPKLFKNEKNGNYYYIDKDKNKVYSICEGKKGTGLCLFPTILNPKICDLIISKYIP